MPKTVVSLIVSILLYCIGPACASDAKINNKAIGDVFAFCQKLQKLKPFDKDKTTALVEELKPDAGKFPNWKFKDKDSPFKTVKLWKDKDNENLVSVITVDINTRVGIKKEDMEDSFGNYGSHNDKSFHYDREGTHFEFGFASGGPPRMCKLVVSRRN